MSDVLPTDHYSRTLRSYRDNPGAVSATSTIHTGDFYGNAETWVVETFRADSRDVVFLQRNGAEGGSRLVLPEPVTAALARHRDQLASRMRTRAARSAVAMRKERGDVLGNPAGLAKANAARAARAKKKSK